MPFRNLAKLVMPEQVLFSLPWAISAILLAWPIAIARGEFNHLQIVIRIALALAAIVLARTAGMSLNRWIDKDIDKANPRTSSRPLQTGAVALNQVIGLSLACLSLLVLIAASLGGLFLLLCPVVLGLLILYSYTKRFTYLCHLVLGVIHSLGPILTYLAVAGKIDTQAIFLGACAGFAITGGDIIYALQDMKHDKGVGLYSLPARFGKERAQKISILFFASSSLSLAYLALCIPLQGFLAQMSFWLCWLFFTLLPLSSQLYLQEDNHYQSFFRCAAALPSFAFFALLLGSFL